MSERKPQRQDSLTDQLRDLYKLAIEHGMYDAADWVRSKVVDPDRLDTEGGADG